MLKRTLWTSFLGFGIVLTVLGRGSGIHGVNEGSIFLEMRDGSGIDYVNVSGETPKHYILSTLGSGLALFDYDLDGDLDLVVLNGAAIDQGRIVHGRAIHLYRNEGGWRFRQVSRQAGLVYDGWGMGCAVGDIDNDGLPDLYVTNVGPNRLFRNRGDGTFVDVTDAAGVGDPGWGTSSAFFDAEGDGDLDLYVANYVVPDLRYMPPPGSESGCIWHGIEVMCGPRGLPAQADIFYRNNDNGTFTEASQEAGFHDTAAAYGLGVVTGDIDDDGDVDVYVANDSMPNFLFRNEGAGFFSEVALPSGVAVSGDGLAQAGMGVDFGDLDGDGRLDIFVTNFSHDTNTVYLNRGPFFVDATNTVNLHQASWFYLGWGTRFVDFDNDGDQDLFVSNGHVYPSVDRIQSNTQYRQRNQLFWNKGNEGLVEASPSPEDALSEVASSRAAVFGDIDNDGAVDVVVVNIDDRLSLLRNAVSGLGRSVHLRLVGRTSNRDSVGAKIRARVGERRQWKELHPSGSFLASNDPRLHVGLGSDERVNELHIRWPSGLEQTLQDVGAGEVLTIVEPPPPEE